MKRVMFAAIFFSSLCAAGCATPTTDLLKKAELQAIHGRNDKALELMDQAVAQDPKSVAVYQARLFLYMRLKNQEKAISDLSKLIELAPNSSQYYMTRGLLYSIDGKNESAIPDFRKACELHDDSGCTFLRQLEVN